MLGALAQQVRVFRIGIENNATRGKGGAINVCGVAGRLNGRG